MLRKLSAIGAPVALFACHSPAYAEAYGPVVPPTFEPYRQEKVREPAAPVEPLAAKRRTFNHWRYAGWAMAVADIASTQSCLKRGTCQEANPLYGKNPSLGKMLAIRVPLEVAIDFAARELFKSHPNTAIRVVQVKTIGTGVVVGLNLRF
jgi:hypothetical protein